MSSTSNACATRKKREKAWREERRKKREAEKARKKAEDDLRKAKEAVAQDLGKRVSEPSVFTQIKKIPADIASVVTGSDVGPEQLNATI